MTVVSIVFLVVISVIAIGKGSDWLSDSLIPLARKMQVSGVAVGSILVSVAVSLPEILVAVYTTMKGYATIGLGVVLGSIICNIGLMTGVSALVAPLKVGRNLILRDGIFSITVPILVFAVSSGGEISRLEGFAFLLLFIPYVANVLLQEKQHTKDQENHDVEIELGLLGFEFGKLKSGWLSFALGLLLLLGGAQLLAGQLIGTAQSLGISDLLVGLTLGAIAPSIPNIMAAFQASKKGMGEIAVSETLGSNIFTLLVTLGLLALLSPIAISDQWLNFDLPAMVFMSLMLFLFLITGKVISRLEGGILVGTYVLILILQVILYA